MAKKQKRNPRTKGELTDKATSEFFRTGRGYIPTDRDDIMSSRQKSWKKHRKTKYKSKDNG